MSQYTFEEFDRALEDTFLLANSKSEENNILLIPRIMVDVVTEGCYILEYV